MKLKGSHIFYIFVILLVGSVYYFDYYRGEEKEKQKEADSILIPIKSEEVSRVEIKNAEGELVLERTDKDWLLKKPVEDLADSEDATAWVQSLTTDKSVEKIGEGENFEWSTYGLDKPKATITVHSKSGTKVQIQVSEKKSIDGNPFIKKDDEKLVYAGNSVWSAHSGKSVKELRDKRILRDGLSELESFMIQAGNETLKLQLKEGRWVSETHPLWTLDQNKVREMINVGKNTRAIEFVLESEPQKAQLNQYGFSKQSIKISYKVKGDKSFIIEFAMDKNNNWYAWPHDLKRIVKVDASSMDKIKNPKLMDYRDREVPFVFNKEDVKKVNIIAEKPIELSKEGEKWKASVPGTVEESEVSQLLEHIRQLRIAEFLDGKTTAPGIDKSSKQFILADQSGKGILDLRVGESFKKKENKIEKTYYYVKSSTYPDAFILKGDDISALKLDKLIKVEKETKAEPGASPEDKKVEGHPSVEVTNELEKSSEEEDVKTQ